MMNALKSKFGHEFTAPEGYIASVTTEESGHRLGGESWTISAGDEITDTPMLVVVLDLEDS